MISIKAAIRIDPNSPCCPEEPVSTGRYDFIESVVYPGIKVRHQAMDYADNITWIAMVLSKNQERQCEFTLLVASV